MYLLHKLSHALLEDKYVPAYRREDKRNRRFRNTTWNVSRRLMSPLPFCISIMPITEQLNNSIQDM